MLMRQPPLLQEPVLDAIWRLCRHAYVSRGRPESARTLRCSLILLSMAAAQEPILIASKLETLLEVSNSLGIPSFVN